MTASIQIGGWVVHTTDAECTVGDDGRCSGCGAFHGAPCPGCGATAYGRPGCERCSPPPPLAIAVVEAGPFAGLRFESVERAESAPYAGPFYFADELAGAAASAKRVEAEVVEPPRFDPAAELEAQHDLGADLGVGPAVAHVLAIDLTSPAVWPVLDPRRGVATSVSRAELVAMPREQLDAIFAPTRYTRDELDQLAEILECRGHEPGPRDPVGSTIYCNGACRRGPLVADAIADVIDGAIERRAAEVASPCHCGYPVLRPIHTGGKDCPRSEPSAIPTVDEAELEAMELEAATVHGFGHADVTMRAQVTISSPPPDPSSGAASVDLRVFARAADQRRDRVVLALLHELAAAVYRATPAFTWPITIIVAGDARLPSGYVGRVRVELEHGAERAGALEVIRAMHELGGRPW